MTNGYSVETKGQSIRTMGREYDAHRRPSRWIHAETKLSVSTSTGDVIPYGLETDRLPGDRHSARQPGRSMTCRGNGGLDIAGRAALLGGLKLLLKTVTLRLWHRPGDFGPGGLCLDTKS